MVEANPGLIRVAARNIALNEPHPTPVALRAGYVDHRRRGRGGRYSDACARRRKAGDRWAVAGLETLGFEQREQRGLTYVLTRDVPTRNPAP